EVGSGELILGEQVENSHPSFVGKSLEKAGGCRELHSGIKIA
ncbi:MAG: hypothetical protein ACI9C2_002312, partial [Gammaproteobacteria bacterium]